MGVNDKVEATFHPQTKVPTAEENPVIMAIEALERLTQAANDTVEGEGFDAVQEDYNLVRAQLDRIPEMLEDMVQDALHHAWDHGRCRRG